jgi:nitroreductase
MQAISSDAVLAQLKWRYAVKQFDATKKIPAETWAKLEEALILSPSSYGLQPWKFFVVTNPEVRAKLHPASWNQPQIVDASHLVVFAVKKGMGAADVERFVKRIAEVRGVPVESLEGYKGMMVGSFSRQTPEGIDAWMSKQVMIALGFFLASAAMLGVDACPMEGFMPEKYDEILGLKAKGYGSVVIATAGYRSADDKYAMAPKVRFAHSDMIEHV